MWLIFGVLAIGMTVLNWVFFLSKKDYRIPMVVAISATALTLGSELLIIKDWVESGDTIALLDVVPSISTMFMVLTIISIILNVLPLIIDIRKNRFVTSV